MFFLIIFIASCSSTKKTTENIRIDDSYTSIFPNKEVSEALEQISRSLVLINNLTFYNNYLFLDSTVTDQDIKEGDVSDNVMMTSTINKSSSGTGTIIGINGNNVSLLTAAHIVSYPDTIITYHIKNGKPTDYIESIMIKKRQNLYSNLPEGGRLRLIAFDTKSDIAIVGNKFSKVDQIRFPVFNFKLGDVRDLNWGDFVYVFGYPMHNKLVTRGIVSMPNKDDLDNFMVDALINRGSSGGLVLAIRGDAPNFELVGIVSSVPAEKKFVLSPANTTRNINLLPGTIYD
ncbi:MAG: trypsin-like peptidase domain-containing protein, partial [Chlorobi bacterium]|nr:trypsin-like peptidase domain-containing protein [Chlorobiota bacterium]